MHVLITADTVGGVWVYVRELASGLLRLGHRVTLVSFGKLPKSAQTEWIDSDQRIEFYATDFRLEWMQNSADSIERSKDYLKSLIERVRPDILHFNQYCYGVLECDLPRVIVAHSDMLSWWTAVHDVLPAENKWLTWYQKTVTAGLSAVDAVIAPSQWMMDALRQHYSYQTRRKVIYNGRTPQLFRPFQKKTKCVLTVGRMWDPAKQTALLLEREHDFPIRVVGPADDPDHTVRPLPPARTHVDYLGEQTEDQLRALFADSSTYAATSRYEPFGLAPLEAALSGCALVANDIPVFHELWDDNVVYFRRNDAEALANVLQQLSHDEKLRSDYGGRALKHARNKFDSSRMVLEYEQLYQELLQAKGAA